MEHFLLYLENLQTDGNNQQKYKYQNLNLKLM